MLPQHLRLRSRRDFKRVYQRGQTLALPTLALYWRKSAGQGPRIGFSVSKKLGGAVQRNRLKRRYRAIARELLPVCPPACDLIFVARPAAAKADYGRLRAEMAQALAQTAQKRGKGASPPWKGKPAQPAGGDKS
jgi:ribonuclease P protein component